RSAGAGPPGTTRSTSSVPPGRITWWRRSRRRCRSDATRAPALPVPEYLVHLVVCPAVLPREGRRVDRARRVRHDLVARRRVGVVADRLELPLGCIRAPLPNDLRYGGPERREQDIAAVQAGR